MTTIQFKYKAQGRLSKTRAGHPARNKSSIPSQCIGVRTARSHILKGQFAEREEGAPGKVKVDLCIRS